MSLDGVIQSEDATLRLYVDHLDLVMRDMADVLQGDHSLTEVSWISTTYARHDGAIQRLQNLFSQHLAILSTRLSPKDFSRLVTAYLVFLQKTQQARKESWHAVLSLLGETLVPETIQRHCSILHELLVATTAEEFEDLRGEGELSALLQLLLEQNNTNLATEMIRQHGMTHGPHTLWFWPSTERFLSIEDLETCAAYLLGQLEEASSLVLRQVGYQTTDTFDDTVTTLSVVQEVMPLTIRHMSSSLSGPLFVLKCIYPLLSGTAGSSAALDFWDDEDQEIVLDSLVREMRSWILDPELCVRCGCFVGDVISFI
jgi:hypothetical protein